MSKKKQIRILLYGLLGLIVIAPLVVFFLINKPHRNVATSEPAYTLTATEIFNQYNNDEAGSNKKFLDKVIQIEGIIQELILENPSEPEAVFSIDSEEGTVTCGFNPEELEKVKTLKTGSLVTIKGACKGFNSSGAELELISGKDVLFSKCTIIDIKQEK